VRAVGAQAELHAELRRARQHRGNPALEPLAQHGAELAVHCARAFAILEAKSVRWIGAQQPTQIGSARSRGCSVGEQTGVKAHESIDARTMSVVARAADC